MSFQKSSVMVLDIVEGELKLLSWREPNDKYILIMITYLLYSLDLIADITGEVSFTDPTRQLFTFDISHIPEGSEVIMAELKVFKERPNHSIFKPGQDGVNSDGPAPNIFIHDHPHTAVVSIKQITGDDVDMDADPADLAANLANQHEGMSAVAVDQRLVSFVKLVMWMKLALISLSVVQCFKPSCWENNHDDGNFL